jgi:hypothetical protein
MLRQKFLSFLYVPICKLHFRELIHFKLQNAVLCSKGNFRKVERINKYLVQSINDDTNHLKY